MAWHRALERLQPRVVSFEEAVTALRESLAELLVAQERWANAAQVLAAIDLESGARGPVEPGYKLAKQLRIAMLYLEDGDPVSAEGYIKKAAALIAASGGRFEPALELQYKVCYARILDSKRRFLEAAHRFYELSNLVTQAAAASAASSSSQAAGAPAASGAGKPLRVDATDGLTALQCAITNTILAPAGPQRSRMLALLCKDERSAALPVFPLLEKVHHERILRPEEIAAFSASLGPHQLAVLPDGSTVLDRSMMQHNLLAASRLYNNISTEQLGSLLGVDAARAEGLAADMIGEGRLPGGSIDQIEGILAFNSDATAALQQWDQQIRSVCGKVSDIAEALSQSSAVL